MSPGSEDTGVQRAPHACARPALGVRCQARQGSVCRGCPGCGCGPALPTGCPEPLPPALLVMKVGGSWVPSRLPGPRPESSCSHVGVAWPACHVPAPQSPPTLAWQCPLLFLDLLLRKAQWSQLEGPGEATPGTPAVVGAGHLKSRAGGLGWAALAASPVAQAGFQPRADADDTAPSLWSCPPAPGS